MDKLENYYRTHRDELDKLDVHPRSWEQIARQLPSSPSSRSMPFPIWVWAAVFIVLVGAGGWWYSASQGLENQASVFPDISLPSPEGQSVPLSSLEGKVILVDFWASWCSNCREKNCEVLLPLYDRYQEEGFEIYAVSLDEDPEQWRSGILRDQINWTQVSDLQGFASPVSQSMGVQQTNTTYLLDANRNILGKNLSRDELEEKIRACLHPPQY
ncbi:MAG: redoxin domain-containing protein [Bacteroidota bacterium]